MTKKLALLGLTTCLVLAGLAGCNGRFEDKTPQPGYGPLYVFVQMPSERWTFTGAFPGRGLPDGVPKTRHDSPYISITEQDHDGLALPAPPSEIIGWPTQGPAQTPPKP